MVKMYKTAPCELLEMTNYKGRKIMYNSKRI